MSSSDNTVSNIDWQVRTPNQGCGASPSLAELAADWDLLTRCSLLTNWTRSYQNDGVSLLSHGTFVFCSLVNSRILLISR